MTMVAVCICAVSDIVLVVVHARPHVVLQTICWTVSARLAAPCKLSGKARMSVLQGNVGQSCRLHVIYHLHLNTGVQLPVCWAFWPAVQLHQNDRILPSFLGFSACLCVLSMHANDAGTSKAALGAGQHQASYLTHGSRAATQCLALWPRGICPFRCAGWATAPAVPFVLFPSGPKAPQGG